MKRFGTVTRGRSLPHRNPLTGARPSARALGSATLLVLGAMFVTWPTSAHASQTFPAELATAGKMPCTPACTVCHMDNEGGAGTAKQLFAVRMMLGGLKAEQPGTVAPALEAVRMAMPNSDNDDLGDWEEITQGRDPNVWGALSVCIPEYGCAVQGAKSSSSDARGALAIFAAGLLAMGLLRRSQR